MLERRPPLISPLPPAAERSTAHGDADKPNGHHDGCVHREDGFGSVTAMIHPPVKGTLPDTRYLMDSPHVHGTRYHTRPPEHD